LHDVTEDTTKSLPDYCSEKVKTLMMEMTFESSADEMIRVWERSDLTKLSADTCLQRKGGATSPTL